MIKYIFDIIYDAFDATVEAYHNRVPKLIRFILFPFMVFLFYTIGYALIIAALPLILIGSIYSKLCEWYKVFE